MITLNKDGRIADLWKYSFGDGWTYDSIHEMVKYVEVKLPKSLYVLVWETLVGALLLPFTWISFPIPSPSIFIRLFISLLCWAAALWFSGMVCIIFHGPIAKPPFLTVHTAINVLSTLLLIAGLTTALTAVLRALYEIKPPVHSPKVSWLDTETWEEIRTSEAVNADYEEFIRNIIEYETEN